MKLLIIAPVPYKKNAHPAPWIMTAIKKLSSAGINVAVLSSATCKKNIEKIDKEGVEYIFIKAPRPKIDLLTFYRIRISRMRKWLKDNYSKYDLIHIYGTEHQYEHIVKGFNIPTLITIQGVMEACVKVLKPALTYQYLSWKLSAKYEKCGVKNVENYACKNDFDSGSIKRNNSDAKIYFINDMIRQQFFTDAYSNKKEKIMFMGGAQKIKGLNFTLKALSVLKEKGYNFKLNIAGRCSHEEITNISKLEGVTNITQDDYNLLGFLDADGIVNAFSECFCLVHPTLIDNSPNSVSEAQITGLPVIATNVGGVSGLIEDNVTGLLCDTSSDSIVEKIEILLDDNFRKEISEKAKKVARERHDSDKILQNTLKIYEEIIGEK